MLRRFRSYLARKIESRLVRPEPLTIIAEDCWGGEFNRTLGHPYTTPLAGVYIAPPDYLTFLENLRQPDAFQLEELTPSLDPACPRGRTPYATIYFLHYPTWEEARAKFLRRASRICWKHLFYKIDFGKPGYTQRDVDRWNALRLEPALALLPPTSDLDLSRVHRGCRLTRWDIDGAAMFNLARRDFNFYAWLRTGLVRKSRVISFLHFLLIDPLTPSRLRRGITFKRPAAGVMIAG